TSYSLCCKLSISTSFTLRFIKARSRLLCRYDSCICGFLSSHASASLLDRSACSDLTSPASSASPSCSASSSPSACSASSCCSACLRFLLSPLRGGG
ncbi:hypothetical protein DUNSADRAFT_15072, partial [Dunaliella salina]